jgi:hypothetical protein
VVPRGRSAAASSSSSSSSARQPELSDEEVLAELEAEREDEDAWRRIARWGAEGEALAADLLARARSNLLQSAAYVEGRTKVRVTGPVEGSMWRGVEGCDFRVIDDVDPSQLFFQGIVPWKPVLLRGAARNWPIREWTVARLPKMPLAKTRVQKRAYPYERQDGGGEADAEAPADTLTLLDFLRSPTASWSSGVLRSVFEAFDPHDPHSAQPYRAIEQALGGWPPAFLDFLVCNVSRHLASPPSCVPFLPPQRPLLQLFAGMGGTGSPHHWHTEALNVLAYGRKLWAILPPADTAFSNDPHTAFFARDPLPPRALFCVQDAGDIVFVPSNGGHAVLNLEPVIGATAEFADAEALADRIR